MRGLTVETRIQSVPVKAPIPTLELFSSSRVSGRTVVQIGPVENGGRSTGSDGRPLFRGILRAASGNRRSGEIGRGGDLAWRRLQAAHLSLRLPGTRSRGAAHAQPGAAKKPACPLFRKS